MIGTFIKHILHKLGHRSRNRVKKIGKITTFFFVSVLYGSPTLELAIHSQQGVPLSSVGVSDPFSVVLTVSQDSSGTKDLTIPGLDKVTLLGKSVRTSQSTVQGTSHVQLSITYTVLAPKPGVYLFGPVFHPAASGVQSNQAQVQVVKSTPASQGSYEEPRYSFILGKKIAYVGEKVPFIARFEWQHPEVKLYEFETPEEQGITVKRTGNAAQKTAQRGAHSWYVLEFPGFLTAEKPGTFAIPKLEASYTLPIRSTHWSSFFSVAHPQQSRVFSQPLEMKILPLPKTDKDVFGIGTFGILKAELSASQVPQGEAVSFILTLFSPDVDFSQVHPPSLEFPTSFKHYFSQGTPDPAGGSYRWEYVVQGLEEGLFTLPAQKIFVFDTHERKYKTLATEPLTIKITAGKVIRPFQQNVNKTPKQKPTPESVPIRPVLPMIPHALFVLLMLILPLFYVGRWLFQVALDGYSVLVGTYTKTYALTLAQKELKKLESSSSASDMYSILYKALTAHFNCEGVRDDELRIRIEKSSVDETLKKDLLSLLSDALKQSSYAEISTHEGPASTDLFAKASGVLDALRKAALVSLVSFSIGDIAAVGSVSHLAHQLESIPFIVWQALVLSGWYSLWFFWFRMSRLAKYCGIILWSLIAVGWALRVPYEGYQVFYVVQPAVLYTGPSVTYPVRAELSPDEEVVVVKDSGEWYHVKSKDRIGWIKSDAVKNKRTGNR